MAIVSPAGFPPSNVSSWLATLSFSQKSASSMEGIISVEDSAAGVGSSAISSEGGAPVDQPVRGEAVLRERTVQPKLGGIRGCGRPVGAAARSWAGPGAGGREAPSDAHTACELSRALRLPEDECSKAVPR